MRRFAAGFCKVVFMGARIEDYGPPMSTPGKNGSIRTHTPVRRTQALASAGHRACRYRWA